MPLSESPPKGSDSSPSAPTGARGIAIVLTLVLIIAITGTLWSSYAWIFLSNSEDSAQTGMANETAIALFALFFLVSALLAYLVYKRFDANNRALKTTLERLEWSEKRLQLAVQAGNIGVWDWPDLKSNRNWWDDHTYRLLGYVPGEMEITSDFFLSQLHPEDRERISKGIQDAFAGGPSKPVQYRLKTKSGNYRWFRAVGSVTYDEFGQASRFTGIIQDIHDQKTIEEALQRANERLRLKSDEMEQMIYMVSHDLKSPLSSITGIANILYDELKSGKDQRKLELIELMIQSGYQMAEFIDDVMDLSLMGKKQHQVEDVPLPSLIDELRVSLSAEIDDARCKLRIATPLPTLRINPFMIRQILQNLISNALKYGCDQAENTIEIGSDETRDSIEIYVQDHGPGIEPDQLESIFTLFHRLDSDKPGSGVGLAIVRRAARLNGGDVKASSELGQGARFTLSLPRSMLSDFKEQDTQRHRRASR